MNKQQRNKDIVNRYKQGEYATKLAEEYNVSPRQIQRICKNHGVIRTQSESFTLAIKQGRMKYHTIPDHLKRKRKTVSAEQRLRVFIKCNYTCIYCGGTVKDGYRLEIDHIDNDKRNNVDSNLQVLCSQCNIGKHWNNKRA